jgi:hypothetical protein
MASGRSATDWCLHLNNVKSTPLARFRTGHVSQYRLPPHAARKLIRSLRHPLAQCRSFVVVLARVIWVFPRPEPEARSNTSNNNTHTQPSGLLADVRSPKREPAPRPNKMFHDTHKHTTADQLGEVAAAAAKSKSVSGRVRQPGGLRFEQG